ncbi:EF-hand domain-containing protein [Actinokineospora iranica]|uniref:Ca2+-binding protein, EF-hand superfamily n=1 Tax=Actinokineospora iranica TaxID=1271860 RepID=A0A1G6TZY5_9PSEU|nr:EF-hand domain-containing protein [Actinokineospora iranica]SDD34638.1 Ca2+-binding protein, EF-hand superfamily [Actinokineospora iranica]
MSRSAFLEAKISHGFDRLDADGDGLLTEHDHVLMGQRAAASLGHQPGSHAEAGIVDAYVRVWRDLHLPHVPGGGDAITKDQFVESTLTLADDPATAQATLGALAEAFLAIADIDQDGRLSPTEFHSFQAGHFPDISEAETREAFQHLDRDGDGYLSAAEFVRTTIEYWASGDPDASGNWWLGRGPGQSD